MLLGVDAPACLLNEGVRGTRVSSGDQIQLNSACCRWTLFLDDVDRRMNFPLRTQRHKCPSRSDALFELRGPNLDVAYGTKIPGLKLGILAGGNCWMRHVLHDAYPTLRCPSCTQEVLPVGCSDCCSLESKNGHTGSLCGEVLLLSGKPLNDVQFYSCDRQSLERGELTHHLLSPAWLYSSHFSKGAAACNGYLTLKPLAFVLGGSI